MKKTSTKKAIICLGVLFFLLGSFIVSAITIDPGRFVATMRIQQINLYYRITSTNSEYEVDDIVKAGLTNYGGVNKGVLYIRPVDSTGNLVDDTNNVVTNPDYATIIGGQMNTNNGDETTIMLGGSKNTAGGHGVVLMGGDANTATVDNAVILGSADSTVGSTNGVIMASYGGRVYGNNSTIFGGGGLITTGADNSFAIGGGVTINHQGVFSYGGSTSIKPNVAQFNAGKGVIVGWTKPNGNHYIKLSVNGALAVGRGQCSNTMIGSIYYKAGTQETTEGNFTPVYCLCACVASGTAYREIALSNQPYCNGVCECLSENPRDCQPSPVKCGTRGSSSVPMAYANGEQGWRVASRFCEDNRPPIGYQVLPGGEPVDCTVSSSVCNPPFPEPGQTVKWTCHGVGYYDLTDCYAYRDVEAPDLAECGRNSKRYSYYDTGWLGKNENDFCKYLNENPADRAHNGELTAYRVLTEEEVEIEYKSGVLVKPFATGENNMVIKNKLISPEGFPPYGGRTYWKCETSNAYNIVGERNEVEGREVTNEKICFADRMPCNTCAKDGFPYCFSVDFSDKCDCTDPAECPVPCLPGADHAGENEIHVSWNVERITDKLRVEKNDIKKVTSHGGNGFSSSVPTEGQEVVYTFGKNTTENVIKYTTDFELKTGSYYCSWTTTISQCPKGYTWDDARLECVKDKCLGSLAAGAVLPEDNEKELEASVPIFLTGANIADSHNVKCASRCAKKGEEYTDRKGNKQVANMDLTLLTGRDGSLFCAKCKEGTVNTELGYCEILDPADCLPPYEWFNIDEGKCALPGVCLGTDYAVQDSKTITPIANALGTETQGQCLSDDVLVGGELPESEKYKCHFTCAKPSVCTDLGSCELPVCDGETSNSGQWLVDNIIKGEKYRRANYDSESQDRISIMNLYDPYKDYFVPRDPNLYTVDGNNKFRFLNSELLNNKTSASFYYNVYKYKTGRVERPTMFREPWIFVEANNDVEFDEKTRGLKGCFYYCTGSDNFRMEILANGSIAYYCGVDPNPCDINPELCQHSGNGGGSVPVPDPRPTKRICYGSIDIKGSYEKSSENYGYADVEPYKSWTEQPWTYSETPTDTLCKYRCTDGYEKITVDGVDYCKKKCDVSKNEYARDYVCMTCRPGTYPTTGDLDKFGNPKGCWSKCTSKQYISSNGRCYSCGAGRMGNDDKDSHGNSKGCKNICSEGRTYWTERPGEHYCGGSPSCCLATYADASYSKKCQEDPTHCKKVGSNCVCNYEMDGV